MQHVCSKVVLVVAAVTMAVMPAAAQAPAQKPSFEVASVKPNKSGNNGVVSRPLPGGRFTITNATLKLLIDIAYSVHDYQISGGPNWIATDRWNLDAKAEEGSIPPGLGPPDRTNPDHPLTLMLQSLIEDRFQLTIHRERKEEPIYALTVAKIGPKMELSADRERWVSGLAPTRRFRAAWNDATPERES